ncbi:hypothetical protein PSHT_05686 [Puccinia striiformis]|uniref:Uncharacterized protein n=1 Tax=Puccinia striiformis TaxID=27350 RepID=A0A2S4WA05_9BASI|nr:hypothetical protein PSHT_05686 [Puccinia striiformis]
MFGSVQKVMSIILMNWKRPKIANINEVALSLLGHWYKITALKLGRSYLTHHPDTYWSMMARIIRSNLCDVQKQVCSNTTTENEDFLPSIQKGS